MTYGHGAALDELCGAQLSAWAKQRLQSVLSATSDNLEDTMLNSFRSLDDQFLCLTADDRYLIDRLLYRMRSGYHNIIPLRGAPGATELCLHTKCADRIGIVAFANVNATYAYILFEDKTMVDGSFTQFEDGTWNIS